MLEPLLSLEFFGSLLATIIGVMVGIPVALWVDRKIAMRHRKEEASRVLLALKDEIKHNHDLLKQIKREIPVSVLFYTLDLSTWQATSEKRLDSIENYELLREISHLYYEYQHMARKIDMQFSMHYGVLRAMSAYPEIRSSIVNPILAHIDPLEEKTLQVISEIERELDKLKTEDGA